MSETISETMSQTAPDGAAGPRVGRSRRSDRSTAALLVSAAAVLFGAGLGAIDLWAPDEPRYAAIAEELRSGRHGRAGLVLLHLNDAPYDQKPPLYFWLAALFGLPAGRVGEAAARLPSALAGIACVGGTFGIARMLRFPIPAAALAAALLATSFRFGFTARRAQLDVLLAACELVAIGLFLLLETRRGGIERARSHPGLLAGLHAALGAAGLVKGPVGWMPLLVFAAWLAWEGRLPALRALAPAWGWLLSLAPLGLWIGGAVALAPPGFAESAIGTNVFARFFAGSSHDRPVWYYAYQLPLDALPWSVLWPVGIAALARRCAGSPAARFVAAWIAVPLLFFTLSAGKRGLYLLPVFPALALVATLAVRPTDGARPARGQIGFRPLAVAAAIVAVIQLAAALFVLPRLDAEKSPRPIAEAIARHRRPGETVGVHGLRPLEGGLAYYGAGRVESIAGDDAARAFLDAGGDLLLLRRRDFERLLTTHALASVAQLRSGRRALVLARSEIGSATRASSRARPLRDPSDAQG